MNVAVSLPWPPRVALWRKGIVRLMDIVLHIGAHRTGSTSFQHYLRGNRERLAADGTDLWEPRMLRKGMLDGLFSKPLLRNGRDIQARAMGRVRINTAYAEHTGAKRLLVTDENMIGAPRACVRAGSLYPSIGERMARLDAAFEGRIKRVIMNVRSLDLWWASVMAYGVGRGHGVPDAKSINGFARSSRTWRDVITDLACAVPQAEIRVLPFEQFAGQPDKMLTIATGRPAPTSHAQCWLARSPDMASLRDRMTENGVSVADLPGHLASGEGRWNPFNTEQAAYLREAYADDMMWLTAGADGLATLTEDPSRTRTGFSLSAGVLTKGQSHDQQTNQSVQRRMAQIS
jgi:hypothetical protein